MMHLDDFHVEIRPEDLGGLACQPKQGVDAGGEIRAPDHRNLRGDSRSSFRSASVWPVVPMTMAFLCWAQSRANGTVLRER